TGNTGYRGNQNNGQGVNNKKKVICYNCHGEGHVSPAAFIANLSSSSSQINEVRTFNDNIFETVYPSWPSEVPQDEHLDSDDDSVHEDYTIPYDQYLATKESQDVPTEASSIPPTASYILLQPGHAPVMVSDSHETLLETEVSHVKISQKPGHVTPVDYTKLNAMYDQTSCDREHDRVLELEAEISKLHNMLKESEKRSPIGSLDKNALETEITQLKDNITSLRIHNDGYKIKIENHTRRYLELSKASNHSRNTSNEKIATLNAEIAKLKPSGSGTKVSRPKTPKKPKVLAPG
nr:hypothetical protein [Tanacetum cinerariifolium]